MLLLVKKHIPLLIVIACLIAIFWKLFLIDRKLNEISPACLPATYQEHRYLFIPKMMPWEDAKIYAESIGGHLVTIANEAENLFVYDFAHKNGCYDSTWIGLSDAAQEGVWKWVTGEPLEYTNWFKGEPNGGRGENYVDIGFSAPYKWNDVNSNARHSFVVEFDK